MGQRKLPFRIVGIGASAGGVEAFSGLLKALPSDSGMAFVLLSHLSPTHRSELARILSPLTRMPVTDALDGQELEPDHVYVLPADKILTIGGGRLHLAARDSSDSPPSAIDQFLESLALDLGPLAAGVILSGTGSDGTAGIRAVKAHGGVTYAQDPVLAAYEGMPRSAVHSGAVDFTLPLAGIARALAQLASQGHLTPDPVEPPTPSVPTDWDGETDQLTPPLSATETEALEAIIRILQTSTGVDFHHYKRPSLVRRVRRRAEDLGVPDLGAYLLRLRQNPAEVTTLFHAVLIKVTSCFLEPGTFQALQTTVIPSLAADRAGSASVRAWVVGCATGEEVYSLAISFLEVGAALGVEVPVRIFASDVSEPALATARLGRYPEAIAADVSPERLARFFVPVDHGYEVTKRLREMCVFARHDVTRDPPFAQLDLVLCCNVLIYLGPLLQRRLLHNTHYALRTGGYLVLGAAETTAGVEGLFSPVDRKNKIYLRRPGPGRLQAGPGEVPAQRPPAANVPPGPRTVLPQGTTADLQRAAERVLFAEYPSASVIVNQAFDILHFQGATGSYLHPPTGKPTVQLLRLAHPDVQLVLGRMLRQVKKHQAPARRPGVRIGTGKQARQVNLSVLPVSLDDGEEPHYLVVFDMVPGKGEGGSAGARSGAAGDAASRMLELEGELAENKEYLQAFIDQQDATHAELQAAYEASLSINEEYQSTNEELESAKEELQSLNEELTTVNEQLNHRNAEVQVRVAEVNSLLEALDMPILLLTRDLRLRAFNSRAAADFHLTQGKVGRQLGETSLPVSPVDLAKLVKLAFSEAKVQELELQDTQGRWRALRVWPIQAEYGAGTAAIAFIDIARLKGAIVEEQELRAYSEAIVETVLEPLLILDGDHHMIHANRAFHQAFGTDPESTAEKKLLELGDGDWETRPLEEFLGRADLSARPFQGPEVSLDSSRFGRRTFRLSAGQIGRPGADRILLALEDVTERRRAEAASVETSRMQAIGQLSGGVAHEVNNQMTVVIGLAGFVLRDIQDDDPRRPDLRNIVKAAERSAAISQQLLAFSRQQTLNPVLFELNTMVGASETLLLRTLGPNISLDVVLGERVGTVRADQAQLEQVLVNLCLNARDAMGGNGRLRIKTTTIVVTHTVPANPNVPVVPRGTYARLMVTDTGRGMDSITKARIFEPFFTTKPLGEGTGLGLASVYGVVRQSGGLIWVESEPGQGSTFTIDLPQVVPVDTPVKPAPALTAIGGGTETILVVEDEAMVRSWVSRCLRELGYVTLEASEGNEALRLIADERPVVELVVSDVSMPGMGGGELRNRLAQMRPGLPVILMSGFGLDDLVRQGILDAESTLLLKPFKPDVLAAKIRELLDPVRDR